MKKFYVKFLILATLLIFGIATTVAICSCNIKTTKNDNSQSVTYTVTYLDGASVFATDKITCGTYAQNYKPQKSGYTFDGWYNGHEKFDFGQPVKDNITLTAAWTPKQYIVKFLADGEIVDEISCSVEEFEALKPSVPQKMHFTAKWGSCVFGSSTEITVNAEYTPIEYTVTLYVENNVFACVNYNVSAPPNLPEPPVKSGYTAKWDGLPLNGGDRELHVVYSPIIYSINFIADGNVCFTQNDYTVETEINFPAIPIKQHYAGKWSEPRFSQNQENIIEIIAEYSPITYFVSFVAEGTVLAVTPFNVEKHEITPPNVPSKTGYEGSWPEYDIVYENFTVEAQYTPIKYTVTFIAGEEKVSEVEFDIENKNIVEPEVPQRKGYSGTWQEYTLELKDIFVYAEYILTFKDEFRYKLSTDKTYYTVTGYSGTEDYIIVPSEHNGLPVKVVGENAFLNNTKITFAEIQSNIEIIENCAFQMCPALEEVILPDTLKSIGEYAFSYCEFKNIILPDGLVSIGEYCFTSSKLTDIIIPEGVKTIGKYAFLRCEQLGSVKFDNCTADVSENMFENCKSLSNVTFGNGISKICTYAFKNCTSLNEILIPVNIVYIENQAFYSSSVNKAYFEGNTDWSLFEPGALFRAGYIDKNELTDPTNAAYLINLSKSNFCWQRENYSETF